MSDNADTYRMAYEAGYMAGRFDQAMGRPYDDRTPLTKRKEAEGGDALSERLTVNDGTETSAQWQSSQSHARK